MDTRRPPTHITRTRVRGTEYILVESPIPPSRALGPRRPLALALSGSAVVVTIWVLGVLASAGTMATAPLLAPGAVARVQPQANVMVQPQAPAESAPAAVQQPKLQPQPPLLQSQSSGALPPLTARADGRTAVSANPTVLVVYVPPGYYPEPEAAKPPTREAAQQTANIVQQVAAGKPAQAVEPAKALRQADPKYAAGVAADLQKATQPTPRYNEVRQVLIALDPSFATRAQPETQTRAQAQTKTDTQAQPETKTQPKEQTQTATDQGAPARTQPNATDRSEVARQVNALVMSTVPAYVKMPFGINEGTLQVNTLVAPTPAFVFNQAQIRAALCTIGGGEVVAVNDTVPNAWELKTTFIPKDPVRWFTVKDAYGKLYYLPNYLDAARDVQVGDKFAGC